MRSMIACVRLHVHASVSARYYTAERGKGYWQHDMFTRVSNLLKRSSQVSAHLQWQISSAGFGVNLFAARHVNAAARTGSFVQRCHFFYVCLCIFFFLLVFFFVVSHCFLHLHSKRIFEARVPNYVEMYTTKETSKDRTFKRSKRAICSKWRCQ